MARIHIPVTKTARGAYRHTVAAPDTYLLRTRNSFGVLPFFQIDDMNGTDIPTDTVTIAGFLVYPKDVLHVWPF
jgi:hypothetical protein